VAVKGDNIIVLGVEKKSTAKLQVSFLCGKKPEKQQWRWV
jgi:hypothetical protein